MYAWLLVSILAASLYSILLHTYPANENANGFKLNFFAALVWVLILFVSNGCTVHLNGEILLWGVAYGIVQALFLLFKAKAMNAGSTSITTLIGNASLLVSIVFCNIAWGEAIGFSDLCGLGLLLAGIFLSTYKRDTVCTHKNWKYYACIFFLLAAAVGIIFKGFGKTGVRDHTGDMLLVAAVTMALFYFCTLLTVKDRSLPFSKKKFLAFILGAGALSCVYNRLNITLSAQMDAVIFFPAFNGGVIVASGLMSYLVYNERLSKRQLIGFALGLVAIYVIGVY